MKNLTSTNGICRTTVMSAGWIPSLLAQVLIAVFCVPQGLKAGTEIHREMTWEQLPAFLEGEKKATVVLTEGGAVRSEGVTVLDGSIHLHRITMATNLKRFSWGSDTVIARGSVKEIRVERMAGNTRRLGLILGIGGGWWLPYAFGVRTWEGWETLAHFVPGPVGGGIFGYFLGRHLDRKTTIITIID